MDDKDMDDMDNDMDDMPEEEREKLVRNATVDVCGDASFMLNLREEWVDCQVSARDTVHLNVGVPGWQAECASRGGNLTGKAFSCFDVWMRVGREMEAGRMNEVNAQETALAWRDDCCMGPNNEKPERPDMPTEEMNMMKSVKAAVDMCGNPSFVLNTRADWIRCQVPGQAEPIPMHPTLEKVCVDMKGVFVGEPYSCVDVWMWIGTEMEAGRMDEAGANEARNFWEDKCCAGRNFCQDTMMKSREEMYDCDPSGGLGAAMLPGVTTMPVATTEQCDTVGGTVNNERMYTCYDAAVYFASDLIPPALLATGVAFIDQHCCSDILLSDVERQMMDDTSETDVIITPLPETCEAGKKIMMSSREIATWMDNGYPPSVPGSYAGLD